MEEDFREAGTRRAEGTALNEKKGGAIAKKADVGGAHLSGQRSGGLQCVSLR